MRSKIGTILTACALSLGISSCALSNTDKDTDKWTNISPGGGGWYRCVKYSPHTNLLLIGGDVSGVCGTRDGGNNWTVNNTGLTNLYIQAIYFHPSDKNIVYLGTRGGVMKSLDGAKTWKLMKNGVVNLGKRYKGRNTRNAPVYAMAIDKTNPEIVYAGLGYERHFGKAHANFKTPIGFIYKSVNGGKEWRKIIIDKNILNESIMKLAIAPDNHNKIYALSESSMFVSEDQGEHWKKACELPFKGRYFTHMTIKKDKPSVMFVTYATLPVGNKKFETGVIKTSDAGKTWKKSLTLTTKTQRHGISHIKLHPKNDSAFLVSAHAMRPGVYRTTDNGTNWKPITSSKTPPVSWVGGYDTNAADVAINPRNLNEMCFINDMEIFQTKDNAVNWKSIFCERVEKETATHPATWKATDRPEILVASSMAIDPRDSRVFYFGYWDVLLWKTIDGGQTCFEARDTPTFLAGKKNHRYGCIRDIVIDPQSPNTVYISKGRNRNLLSIYKTENGGKNFKKVTGGKSGMTDKGAVTHIVINPKDTKTLYANVDMYSAVKEKIEDAKAKDAGVYKSTDGGNTWKQICKGLPKGNRRMHGLVIDPVNPDILYTCTRLGPKTHLAGYIAKSTNGGNTWKVIMDNVDARCLAIDPFDHNIVYAGTRDYSKFNVNKIFWRSENGGETWKHIPGDAFNVGPTAHPGRLYFLSSIATDPKTPGRVYAGFRCEYYDLANHGGIFVSDDRGETWRAFSSNGLGCFNISRLLVDPHNPKRIYAMTSGTGLWRYGPAPEEKSDNILDFFSIRKK